MKVYEHSGINLFRSFNNTAEVLEMLHTIHFKASTVTTMRAPLPHTFDKDGDVSLFYDFSSFWFISFMGAYLDIQGITLSIEGSLVGYACMLSPDVSYILSLGVSRS